MHIPKTGGTSIDAAGMHETTPVPWRGRLSQSLAVLGDFPIFSIFCELCRVVQGGFCRVLVGFQPGVCALLSFFKLGPY